LLAELLPRLKRVGALLNMGNRVVPSQWAVVEASARALGLEPHLLDIRRPEDLPGAFEAASKRRVEGLLVGLDGVTQSNLRPIAELAARHRMPGIYPSRDYPTRGGLMGYGARLPKVSGDVRS
jgi:putative ABC transport system substrate-binding protein